MHESLETELQTMAVCSCETLVTNYVQVYMVTSNKIKVKVKSKVHPRTGREGTDGE